MKHLATFWATAWLVWCAPVAAQGVVHQVPTRAGVSTSLFWEAAPQAQATVLVFPGGGGGFGKVVSGRPGSNNFLVRTEPDFVAQGLNVAIFGKPSDSDDLGYADRITEAHLADVRAVLAFVKTLSALPVWVVGTSRGTVSATATAIKMGGAVAGLVLSSSVVSVKKPGAVVTQDLAAIQVPVLLLHHQKDACWVCRPSEVPAILTGLTHAPVKQLVMVDGGANPSGEACGALHWHGYIGMEHEAVRLITDWIKSPRNE